MALKPIALTEVSGQISAPLCQNGLVQMACEVVAEAMESMAATELQRISHRVYVPGSAAVYVTEGTNEIQKLSIGRALTGIDAFG